MLYQFENRDKSGPLTADSIEALTPFPHIHPHLELIYLLEGSSEAIVDNKNFLIEKGDLFLSFPNQIHSYHDYTPIKGNLIIFTPDSFSDLKKLFQTKTPDSPIIKSDRLGPDISQIMKTILQKNNTDSPYDKLTAKGYLLALLGELLPLMTLRNAPADEDSIKKILTYCSEHYTEPISLDILSKELHLNKYYISHIIKERIDMGFVDFLNRLRLEHACNLLKKDENITDVALSSGFPSIRTFNRVFAQNMGMPPRDYIKAKEAELTGKK